MVEHPTPTPSDGRTDGRPHATGNTLAQLAAERTAALVIGALGGGLLVAAAGTFIAVRWDRLGLEAKAGLVALVAVIALGCGWFLRQRAPGTSGVLTHLGGFLIPIDVGGVATAIGLGRAQVGIIAGAVGFAVLTGLDGQRIPGTGRSPFMALGRVLSLGATGLGAASMLGVAPSIVFVLGALAVLGARAALPISHQRHRFDGVGLAALAGSGPALDAAAGFSQPGSLVDWLSDLTAAGPLTVVITSALAAALAVLIDRGALGTSVAVVVGALAAPSAVELIVDHQQAALLVTAALVLTSRVALLASTLTGRSTVIRFSPLLDAAALSTGAITIAVAVANLSSGAPADVGALAAAALLAVSWLVSDLEGGIRLDTGARLGSLVRGDTGPISTVGLVGSAIAAAVATADGSQAAMVLAAAAAGLGLTSRAGASFVARGGLVAATVVAFGNPWLALALGSGSALLLQGRALLDFGRGVAPRPARVNQWFGLAALALGVLRFAGSSVDIADAWQLAAAGLVATVLALLALSSDHLSVPDLRLAPRAASPLVLLPLLGHPEAIGLIAMGCAVLLFLDRLVNQQQGSDVVASGHLVFGSWILAAAQGVESGEAYVAGPVAVLLWFGTRATANGASSWLGIGPGLALLGLVALLERAATGVGWHGAVAGAVGLAAMAVGVERHWSAPTAIGLALVVTTVSIEAAAVIPQLPVWVLLAMGGTFLLSTGFFLERRAGSGAAASLRNAWAQFT